jgi:menaquinone-dependent protoporphyrinogen oxidase
VKRVLVTWGSKSGGTEGLGRLIAARLEHRGFEVVAEPVEAIDDLDGLDAVILGGALYANRWTASARRFARRHLRQLRERPVWLFSSGPLDDSAAERAIPPTHEVATLVQRIGALGHETFGGRLAEDTQGFPGEAMAKEHAGDWRDPNHVRRWTDAIADALPDATAGEWAEPPARSGGRLLLHGLIGAAVCAALVVGAPLVLGDEARWIHAILAPLVFVLVSHQYFRVHGSRDPLPTAATFALTLAAVEIAVVDARLQSTQLLDSPAFWVPLALVFLLTWATGALMATLPWSDPNAGGALLPSGEADDHGTERTSR